MQKAVFVSVIGRGVKVDNAVIAAFFVSSLPLHRFSHSLPFLPFL